MNKLDWSKAPEGTTHCHVNDLMPVGANGEPFSCNCWEKHTEGTIYEWCGYEWLGLYTTKGAHKRVSSIPRPEEPQQCSYCVEEIASLCKQSNMTLSFYGDTIQLFCEDTERQSDDGISLKKAVEIMQAKIVYLNLIEDFI